METGHGPEEYSFIQEIIKEEKINVKKVGKNVCKWTMLGLVFGMAACLSFHMLKPWAETRFQQNPDKVEIPTDDELIEDDPVVQEPEQEQELTIDSYRELNILLGEVAVESQKSVVHVSGIKQDQSWITGVDNPSSETTGLIVADNGREILILTNYSSMKEAQLFRVEFADGSVHEGVMKQKDGTIDLAIFSVAKSGLTDDTWNQIKVAMLGRSNTFIPGRTLMAIGSPFGLKKGLGYGIASSVDEIIVRADGEYNIIVTDMPESEHGNGFLFDAYGNVIGVIDARLADEAGTSTLAAIGISDIKSEIELMSNGKNVPYIGIIGTIVTEEMSEAQGIPAGLYVNEVKVDSPAMKAGIQSGDIITSVGKTKVVTMKDYHKAVLAQEAGKTVKITGQRFGAESYVDIKFNVTVGVVQ